MEICNQAYENRKGPANLIFHSDQDTQYTACKPRNLLRKIGVM